MKGAKHKAAENSVSKTLRTKHCVKREVFKECLRMACKNVIPLSHTAVLAHLPMKRDFIQKNIFVMSQLEKQAMRITSQNNLI